MLLSADQLEFRDTLRRFVKKEVEPIASDVDREDRFPSELVPKFGDMGLLQLRLPEEYGGPGANLTTVCIAAEELARASEAIALISGQNGIGLIVPLIHFGNEEQRERFFPEVAKGRTLTAVAITEPNSGSDVGSMKTRAVRDGNHSYLLNGEFPRLTRILKFKSQP